MTLLTRALLLACAIAQATISGKGAKFKNGIRIGLTDAEVFAKYFESAEPAEIRNYRVLELVSGLDGIWHFYGFQSGKLARIDIKSTYPISAYKL